MTLFQIGAVGSADANQALRRRFVFLLIGLQMLLAAVVIVGALQYARVMRDSTLNEHLNRIEGSVLGVEDHLTQTLYLVGLTLSNLQDLSGYRPGESASEIQASLEKIQRQMPVLRSLSFADHSGRIVASSVAANVGRQIELDRLLPQVAPDRIQLLRLGAPWEGRDFADGRATRADQPADPRANTFFPLALSLPGDDALLAVAAINTDYFLNRLVGSIDRSPLHVSVFDYNGIQLLGNEVELPAGSRAVDDALLARVKREEIGQQRDARIDGKDVLTAFRASRNYPFFVVGHAEYEAVLAQWREETLSVFAMAGLALLATLLITGVLTIRLLFALTRESRLHEAQRLAARVFENSNDGIIIAGPDTVILSVNPAFERTSGYRRDELVGQKPRMLASRQHSRGFYARMWQILNEYGEWQGEIINSRKNGSALTEWLTITHMPDSDGKPGGYLGFFHDLSELRRSEQLVRQLSAAVEQSPISIFMTTLEPAIVYVNPQFTLATGYTPEEAIGRNPRFLQSKQTSPETFRDMWAHLLVGDEWEGEFINRRKDGSIFYDHAKLAPIRDGSGKIVRYLAIQHDISARKAAEAALIEAKEAAEAASRAKSSFLANMSHELRTPMNGIMGMLELSKRRMIDPNGLVYIDKARGAADRLLAVLNDILDLSKIEAERMVLEDDPLLIASVVAELSAALSPKAGEKGLNLEFDIPDDLSRLPLKGDSLRLGQILLNLAGNAVKFTHHGGITVRARPVEQSPEAVQVRFEVIDTGIGIEEEALSRLFRSFEQADNSMTRRYGGTGLGLAISKRLVQLMGGQIGVDSTPGVGSSFWFVLRLKRQAPSAIASVLVAVERPASERLHELHAGKRILLAEDEPSTQLVARELLEVVGLVVDVAVNGERALDLSSQKAYALILMDMQMPVLNGLEATRAIRVESQNRETPILALTANAYDEDRDRCLAAGMDDHIAKPVVPEHFYDALLRWLSRTGS